MSCQSKFYCSVVYFVFLSSQTLTVDHHAFDNGKLYNGRMDCNSECKQNIKLFLFIIRNTVLWFIMIMIMINWICFVINTYISNNGISRFMGNLHKWSKLGMWQNIIWTRNSSTHNVWKSDVTCRHQIWTCQCASKNSKRRLDLARSVKKSIYTINGKIIAIIAWIYSLLPFQHFLTAIWLLPRDNHYGGWPKSGEIDMMESKGGFFYYYKSCIKII